MKSMMLQVPPKDVLPCPLKVQKGLWMPWSSSSSRILFTVYHIPLNSSSRTLLQGHSSSSSSST